MNDSPHPLSGWTPEQIAQTKRWVETRKKSGVELERIRREVLLALDTFKEIELLCGDADYTKPPYAPLPTSGLVKQRRWFLKIARSE